METRKISVIAMEIINDWQKVNFAALPYLKAMLSINYFSDSYGYDNGKTIVLYFLSNASTYKGETAKRLKLELKNIIK
jgi:hypothetical protein